MKKLDYYFKKAAKENFAIGQFNVSTLEALKAVVAASGVLNSPVIVGVSEGESRFLGLKQIVSLVKVFREETKFPIFLNLDHGKTFEYIKKAIDAGFDSCHFDGSQLKFEENIIISKQVVKYAKGKGVFIEGEIGFVKGSSTLLEKSPEINYEDLTDPLMAKEFINKTGIDRLAVNVGTFHGVNASGDALRINLQRLEEIRNAVGNFPLVLHGASGVLPEDIKKAINLGIRKINLNTELRLAFTNALKRAFDENPKEIIPYKYLPGAAQAVQKIVEEKINLFGSNNKI
ncbi:MAG: class II fructose-bisphosphate aldolase [Candidatus Parcubacteria bacterium]|nr:class II fructose-bisphosphate aldolase [Candidatus Parcubacteria bacterium]